MSTVNAVWSALRGGLLARLDRVVRPSFGGYWAVARQVHGWTGRQEAIALFEAVMALPPDAIVVEVGTFLGRSSIVLGGACRTRQNGRVYCIDPFDGSGDDFSRPVYDEIRRGLARTQLDCFRENLVRAGLADWIEPKVGTAEHVSRGWRQPVDMLFLDGDQSPEGMRSAFDCLAPHLKAGALLVVHNSADRVYAPGHDGGRRLVLDVVVPPAFSGASTVGTTTFARRLARETQQF